MELMKMNNTFSKVAAVAAPLLLAVAPFLPTVGAVSLSTVALIVAFLLAAAAGLSLPQVKFAAGKPLIPLTVVPVATGAVALLMQLAESLTGTLAAICYGLALVISFLAGLASPTLKPKVDPEVKARVAKELSK